MLGGYADLGLALQTAKGTPASSAAFRTMLAGGSYLPARTVAEARATTTLRTRRRSYMARVGAEGSPQWLVRPDLIGLVLYGAFGYYEHPGLHRFRTSVSFGEAASLPWLTAWTGIGDGLFAQMADTKVKTLTLASHAGGVLSATAALVGISPTFKSTGQMVDLDAGDPFLHADGAAGFYVDGNPIAEIEDIVITIETGAALADSLAGLDIRDGLISVRIKTTQAIADAATWNRLHFGTDTPGDGDAAIDTPVSGAIDLSWTQPGGAYLDILADRLTIDHPIEGLEANTARGPLKAQVTYILEQDAYSEAVGLEAYLNNAVASYT